MQQLTLHLDATQSANWHDLDGATSDHVRALILADARRQAANTGALTVEIHDDDGLVVAWFEVER